MIKERYIFIFFSFLLVLFFLILTLKTKFNQQPQAEKDTNLLELRKEISAIKESLDALKNQIAAPASTEKATETIAPNLNQPSNASSFADNFITEVINRENLDTKTIWNPTNKPSAYILSINLQQEPNGKTILVWTGLGILPFSSYRAEGRVLNILFTQSKEAFINNNNFINVRYIPKAVQ